MERLKRAALLTRLAERLREQGSWCGETHIQKAALFLQDLMEVPLDFEFVLYKHGPFSFDLRDELTSLRADELIKLEPQWPYGPRIVPTERSKYIQGICSNTLARYEKKIDFVAQKLGGKGVADLERLATAFFVTQEDDEMNSQEERAERLTELKPHITKEGALEAVSEVDRILEELSN